MKAKLLLVAEIETGESESIWTAETAEADAKEKLNNFLKVFKPTLTCYGIKLHQFKPLKARVRMTKEQATTIAKAMAKRLLRNGVGQTASRLVLEGFEGKPREMGDWRERTLVDELATILADKWKPE